jgi:putative FmdB family regulatory protein
MALTYEYICEDESCKHEWEHEAEINDPKLTHCPKCGKETAKRLISGGSGRGIVEYTGHELIAKVKEDTQKLKRHVYSNENAYANVVGESKYQSNVKHIEQQNQIRRSK